MPRAYARSWSTHARSRSIASVLAALSLTVATRADTIWDEDSDGNLSDDWLNPTQLVMPEGTSSLYAYSGEIGPDSWDREYFTFNLAAGLQLSQMILVDYYGQDGTGFVGVQSGPIITVDPENASPADLLGWHLFGTSVELLGTDYLPLIGHGAGAIGFEPPLPSGQYTFWMQQLGPICNYQWDFVVTPEPASLLTFSLAAILARRRRA